MSDRKITLYNCNPGDVFEVSKEEVASWDMANTDFDVVHLVAVRFGSFDLVKSIVFTDYDFDRGVYTVECK